jgi:hypothetical protein
MFGESTYGVLPNPIYKEVGKIAKVGSKSFQPITLDLVTV